MSCGVQEELRQEHAQRVSAQALVEQHKQQLADLKLEASCAKHLQSMQGQAYFPSYIGDN